MWQLVSACSSTTCVALLVAVSCSAVLAGGHSGVVHSPIEVLQSLVAHHWTIDFQQQVRRVGRVERMRKMRNEVVMFFSQDAHELYHVLLMTLEEEMVCV